MMMMPLTKPDLPPFEAIEPQVREVLANGRVSNFGKYVRQLENEASALLGATCIAVSSGTVGLKLALQALHLTGRGEYSPAAVVVPSFTFAATGQAVLDAGHIPVFADCDLSGNISVADVDELLAGDRYEDIKAVMGVHLYGNPCNVRELRRSAIRGARAVIFDGAHALGSGITGKLVGAEEDVSVFSLSATKPITAMEGGLVCSCDEGIIDRVRASRNYGIGKNYEAVCAGTNGKMPELNAIVGLYNLERMDELLRKRSMRARAYGFLITTKTPFRPLVPFSGGCNWKDFPIRVPSAYRQAIRDHLTGAGIETRTYYDPPLHRHPLFSGYSRNRELPMTDELAASVLVPPFYASMTDEEMEYVVDELRKAAERAS